MSSCYCIFVLKLLNMCPRTTIYVSSYSGYSTLLYVCPHTTICVLVLLYMCPHTQATLSLPLCYAADVFYYFILRRISLLHSRTCCFFSSFFFSGILLLYSDVYSYCTRTLLLLFLLYFTQFGNFTISSLVFLLPPPMSTFKVPTGADIICSGLH